MGDTLTLYIPIGYPIHIDIMEFFSLHTVCVGAYCCDFAILHYLLFTE